MFKFAELCVELLFLLSVLNLFLEANATSAAALPNGKFCSSISLFFVTVKAQVNVDATSSKFSFRASAGGISVPSSGGLCTGSGVELKSGGKAAITPSVCLEEIMEQYSVSQLVVQVESLEKVKISVTVPLIGKVSVNFTPCEDSLESAADEVGGGGEEEEEEEAKEDEWEDDL